MTSHTLNESRRRFEPVRKECSFCKKGKTNKKMDDNYFAPVYRTQNRTNLIVYRNVKFNEIKIGVPRCKSCANTHSNIRIATYFFIFIGVLLVFVIPIYMAVEFDLGVIVMIIAMAMTIGLVYLAIVGLEQGILNSKEMISEKEGAKKEPLVREFIRNGWTLERPTA